jgi:hypothetical protein
MPGRIGNDRGNPIKQIDLLWSTKQMKIGQFVQNVQDVKQSALNHDHTLDCQIAILGGLARIQRGNQVTNLIHAG